MKGALPSILLAEHRIPTCMPKICNIFILVCKNLLKYTLDLSWFTYNPVVWLNSSKMTLRDEALVGVASKKNITSSAYNKCYTMGAVLEIGYRQFSVTLSSIFKDKTPLQCKIDKVKGDHPALASIGLNKTIRSTINQNRKSKGANAFINKIN